MLKYVKLFSVILITILFLGCNDSDKTSNSNNSNQLTSSTVINLDNYPLSDLNDTQKYALAYMWNEEKLAYDIYLELNTLYPSQTFVNIAIKSESTHIELVENLIQRYDINITNLQDSLDSGVYGVSEIQDLYNTLYSIGDDSLIDALKVACMVEVTDVDDLDKYITDAADAQDLVDTFTVLRAGSYNHYWAFDNALKREGITDGCCSLGTIDETSFCKTTDEYPRN